MKIIIFLSILLAIASSQCVGYKADGTCYNPYSDTNSGYGWGYINYCAKYSIDPPNTCDTCLDGITGKTCYDTTKYPQFFGNKGTTGVDDQYNCYFAEDDMNWWDNTHRAGYVFPWTSYTCVDANK